MTIEFGKISQEALNRFPGLLYQWFPDGRVKGIEFVARNPRRDDRNIGSFSVNISSGRWCDFATGDKGGDPISLYAFVRGIGQGAAAYELAREMGVWNGG